MPVTSFDSLPNEKQEIITRLSAEIDYFYSKMKEKKRVDDTINSGIDLLNQFATNPETVEEHKEVPKRCGGVARKARLQLEKETGQKEVTSLNTKIIKQLKKANDE